jgi:hypothetical protein
LGDAHLIGQVSPEDSNLLGSVRLGRGISYGIDAADILRLC